MSQSEKKKIVILGAGLAGLRLGSQLADSGFRVEIYEKEAYVGGLLRTVEKNGFVFDLGPHILFSEHLDFYKEMFGEDLITLDAVFGIGFGGKQIRSPIDPLDLMKTLSPVDSVPLAIGLASKMLLGSDPSKARSANEWVSAKFGKRANEYFFKYYIEKSTGRPAENVSHHWGTERHRFYKEHNLWERSRKLIARIFKRSKGAPLILYYPREGVQAIAEKMAKSIKANGGEIFLNSTVTGVEIKDGLMRRALVDNENDQIKVEADLFANTLPITVLWNLLAANESLTGNGSPLKLDFRNLWLLYFFINRPRLTDKVLIYFPEKHYSFKRIYEPKNLDPKMGKKNMTGICAEVGYTDGDEISGMSEDKLVERVKREISEFYSLQPDEFIEHFSIKVPYSYPTYELGYENEIMRVASVLFDIENLFSLGRQGLFRYDYMTNRVLESADALADFIRSRKRKEELLAEPQVKSLFY